MNYLMAGVAFVLRRARSRVCGGSSFSDKMRDWNSSGRFSEFSGKLLNSFDWIICVKRCVQ